MQIAIDYHKSGVLIKTKTVNKNITKKVQVLYIFEFSTHL